MRVRASNFDGNGGHYRVVHDVHGISRVCCQFCDFAASRMDYRRGSDKSGQGRYNRMRGAVVRHLHERHLDLLREIAMSSKAERSERVGAWPRLTKFQRNLMVRLDSIPDGSRQ